MLFLFGGLGAVVLGRYAQKKLLEYQDREAAECLAQFRYWFCLMLVVFVSL